MRRALAAMLMMASAALGLAEDGRGASARVRVIGQDGLPVECAEVAASLEDEPVPREVEWISADADGWATLDMPWLPDPEDIDEETRIAFLARAESWVPALIAVRPGESPPPLVLRRGTSLAGWVRDASGAPVANAWVRAESLMADRSLSGQRFGQLSRPTLSGPDGAFLIEDLAPGPHDVHASDRAGRRAQDVRVSVRPDGTKGIVVTLLQNATPRVRGVVRDAKGPVQGASVREDFIGCSWVGPSLTGPDGRFEVGGTAGEAMTILVRAPGRSPARVTAMPNGPLVEVVLQPGGAIDGTLTADPGDNAGAHCRGSGPDDFVSAEIVDRRFVADGLAPGAYACEVNGSVGKARREGIVVEPGRRTPVTLSLVPHATAIVRVIAPDGTMNRGAEVIALGSCDAERVDDGVLLRIRDADGCDVRVEAEGFFEEDVNVRPSDEPLDVLVTPAGRWTGVVVDAAGMPVAGADVSGGWRSARTDAEGRFELDRSQRRVVLSAVRVGDTVVERGSLEAEASGDAALVLQVLPEALATLTMIVRDSGGPVAGAEIEVEAEPVVLRGRADDDGRFVARGLPPGYVEARVIGPAHEHWVSGYEDVDEWLAAGEEATWDVRIAD